MKALAGIYDSGKDLPQDETAVFHWTEKAASLNDAGSMADVAGCYDLGIGVPADMAKANEWYQKTAATISDTDIKIVHGQAIASLIALRKEVDVQSNPAAVEEKQLLDDAIKFDLLGADMMLRPGPIKPKSDALLEALKTVGPDEIIERGKIFQAKILGDRVQGDSMQDKVNGMLAIKVTLVTNKMVFAGLKVAMSNRFFGLYVQKDRPSDWQPINLKLSELQGGADAADALMH